MKLTFLGTRGCIGVRTSLHRMHSALLLSHKRQRAMIDCGEDWAGKLGSVSPHAIVVTHAHPDHAFGLRDGADCPVYATQETWQDIADFPIAERHVVTPRKPLKIRGISFEAFRVVHSILAPAVGYRIRAGRVTIFYVPDLIDIEERSEALSGVRLYVGDGASLVRPIVRRKGKQLFGHTTIRAQLGWCEQSGVERALFTHCGSQIVGGDRSEVETQVRDMGRERGVEAGIAHDGMEILLRERRRA